MEINIQHDCTQREVINDIVGIIAKNFGFDRSNGFDFTTSDNRTDITCTEAAIEIVELITGTEIDYSDDPQPVDLTHYFQIIEYEPFQQYWTVKPIEGRCYREGEDKLLDTSQYSFVGLLTAPRISNKFAAGTVTDSAMRQRWVYSVSWLESEFHCSRFYVLTNFDIELYQKSLGLPITVYQLEE